MNDRDFGGVILLLAVMMSVGWCLAGIAVERILHEDKP